MKPGQFAILIDSGGRCLIGDHFGNVIEKTSAQVTEMENLIWFILPLVPEDKPMYPNLSFTEYQSSDGRLSVEAAFVPNDPGGMFWYAIHISRGKST